MTTNPDTLMTLDQAVSEVMNSLTGLDLSYVPNLDKYRSVTHMLNRALRLNALEKEWSYYSDVINLGYASAGSRQMVLPSTRRARVINDDSVRLVDEHGIPRVWASFLPRDALSKHAGRRGLWCAFTNGVLYFSRCLTPEELKLSVEIPVMREPRMFEVPQKLESVEQLGAHQEDHWQTPPTGPHNSITGEGIGPDAIESEIRNQILDFSYADLITARAAYLMASADPVYQPRAQTLEAAFTDIKYQVIERDDRNTDSPYLNEFQVPVQNNVLDHNYGWTGLHQHADERF